MDDTIQVEMICQNDDYCVNLKSVWLKLIQFYHHTYKEFEIHAIYSPSYKNGKSFMIRF